MLPMLGTSGLVAFLSGRLTDRVGMRRVILAGDHPARRRSTAALVLRGRLRVLALLPAWSGWGGAGLFYPDGHDRGRGDA